MDDMDDAGMQEFFMGLEDTQEESEDAKQNDLGAGITREELATCCRVLKILGILLRQCYVLTGVDSACGGSRRRAESVLIATIQRAQDMLTAAA